MKLVRSASLVPLALFVFVFFLRLMLQGSSRPKPTAVLKTAEPIGEVAPHVVIESKPTSSRHAGHLGRRLAALAVSSALLTTLLFAGAGAVLADEIVDSPGPVQSDTTQLKWTGQGAPVTQKCDADADGGAGGYQNGATADNYMVWIFTTDGGSVTGEVTLTINGTTYGNAHAGGQYQIVTPYVDPATITLALANFTVDTTGNGSWILTISHGCDGTVEDRVIDPHGSIFGPCADPAYYATFDNTASTVPITFRLRWYNMLGLNVKVRSVPGGAIWTTWQHWARPGTYVSLWYKDPDTALWKLLDRELVVSGRYPACQYTPGWGNP